MKLLVFSSATCGPCKLYSPQVDKVAVQGYNIQKLDVADNTELVEKYRVRGVPTSIIVDEEGTEIHRFMGAKSAPTLKDLLDSKGV